MTEGSGASGVNIMPVMPRSEPLSLGSLLRWELLLRPGVDLSSNRSDISRLWMPARSWGQPRLQETFHHSCLVQTRKTMVYNSFCRHGLSINAIDSGVPTLLDEDLYTTHERKNNRTPEVHLQRPVSTKRRRGRKNDRQLTEETIGNLVGAKI
ncbi:uncharacterized protein BO96DRAFT_235029 [Aspergillus niger CBS 101883]|uniref:uncharacterized protein n=1 Tax=Aspergillus lacticoffeatus (strain CBS 101883) TaxID=1450533 RepID=UPI000D7EE3A0|nr:uncharacterized protein BO96DRAFT_235029 [Aspergillus niger CBS 101883]PYH59164.1 hypothetical protein BO96DRAFT_235029 [Aspergillus niger CBS 101883]